MMSDPECEGAVVVKPLVHGGDVGGSCAEEYGEWRGVEDAETWGAVW